MDADEKDLRLLALLQRDARLSYRELAKRAKMSVLTVMKRVKALEREGIIRSYAARIDFEMLGYDVHAMIKVRIAKGKLFDVERRIAMNRNVYAVLDHTGHFDTTLLCRFKNTRALDTFLKQVQTYDFVERTETLLILNTIKQESVKL